MMGVAELRRGHDLGTGARAGLPQVVFHGFDEAGCQTNNLGVSTIDGELNVTRFVTSLSWTHALQAPYETIDLTLKVPQSAIQTILPGPPVDLEGDIRQPSTGFWVVLYLPNEDANGHDTYSAIHWGVCTKLTIRGEPSQETGGKTVTIEIGCESWASAILARNTICMAPASTFIRDGYSYTLRQWGDEISALIAGSVRLHPGEVFDSLFHSMLPMLIPTTLSSFTGTLFTWTAAGEILYSRDLDPSIGLPEGATVADLGLRGLGSVNAVNHGYRFSEAIKFVWNRDQAAVHCPIRALNHKAVTGWGLGRMGNQLPRGTTWGFFQSTFFPIPLIECFPSMEWPLYNVPPRHSRLFKDTVYAAAEYENAAKNIVGEGGERAYHEVSLEELAEHPEWKELEKHVATTAIDELVPATESPNDPDWQAPLAEALGGSCPVLIYRMRPTLLSAINGLEATGAARRRYGAFVQELKDRADVKWMIEGQESASEKVGLNQRSQIVYPYSNLVGSNGLDPWNDWTSDQVYSFTWQYSEDQRCNATYAKTPLQPQSQMELHGLWGKPIVDGGDVGKHGLRLQTQDWPFFAPGADIEIESSDTRSFSIRNYKDRLTSLGEEFFTTVGSSDHSWIFGRGSFSGVYKPWCKAGYYMRVFFESDRSRGTGTPNYWIPYAALPEKLYGGADRDKEKLYGGADRDKYAHPGFMGYATSVTHSVFPDQATGAIRGTTSVELERLSVGPGAGAVPHVLPIATDARFDEQKPPFIVSATGQRVTGSVTVNDDGTITFVPDPVPGG